MDENIKNDKNIIDTSNNLDNGSNINKPILEFKIDSNTDIANTVMTPPKTLPQDTLPFSPAKLNFFIIVRFLINTMICISIKKQH